MALGTVLPKSENSRNFRSILNILQIHDAAVYYSVSFDDIAHKSQQR